MCFLVATGLLNDHLARPDQANNTSSEVSFNSMDPASSLLVNLSSESRPGNPTPAIAMQSDTISTPISGQSRPYNPTPMHTLKNKSTVIETLLPDVFESTAVKEYNPSTAAMVDSTMIEYVEKIYHRTEGNSYIKILTQNTYLSSDVELEFRVKYCKSSLKIS